MRFGSVCSGIEAASCAWDSLGWEPAWFSEIEPFPSSVLAHRYPGVKNHGSLIGLADRLVGRDREIDVLVGGTPCQGVSIAGKGRGLGPLPAEYCRLAEVLRPRWCLWENVPNVLSKKHAADFSAFFGRLVELGYGVCWRVLDARFFGVPQRRRRVFLVASLGGAAPAGAVLLEPESLRRDPPPRRASREEATGAPASRAAGSGERGGLIPEIAGTLGGGGRRGPPVDLDRSGAFIPQLAATVTANQRAIGNAWNRSYVATNAEGSDGFTLTKSNISKHINNQTPLVAFDPTQVTHPENRSTCNGDTAALARSARAPHIAYVPEEAGTLLAQANATGGHRPPGTTVDTTSHLLTYSVAPESGQGADLVATEIDTAPALTATAEANGTDRGVRVVQCVTGEQTHTLTAGGHDASEDGTGRGTPIIPATKWKVRRLTPMECERLQAFPDGWTNIPGSSDSTRYASLGNSMAVVVMKWIGARITMVDQILRGAA